MEKDRVRHSSVPSRDFDLPNESGFYETAAFSSFERERGEMGESL